jgi:glycosyltransferase involved in cell wall biosynthesis
MAAGEAQACGTPVVAFRRGALSEVIMDGVPRTGDRPRRHGSAADGAWRPKGVMADSG